MNAAMASARSSEGRIMALRAATYSRPFGNAFAPAVIQDLFSPLDRQGRLRGDLQGKFLGAF